jgi:hypothetical protein
MEIAKFLPTADGQFYLLSYWLADGIRAFPSGRTFENILKPPAAPILLAIYPTI